MAPQLAAARVRAARAVGYVATGAALGISEFMGGLISGVPSPTVSVADRVIDSLPAPLVHFGVQVLGPFDKPFIIILILALTLFIGGRIGGLAARNHIAGAAWLAVFTLLGFLACLGETGANVAGAALAALVTGAAAIGTLYSGLKLGDRASAEKPADDDATRGLADRSRREFLGFLGGVALVAVVAAATGRILVGQVAATARNLLRLPQAATPAPPLPRGVSLDVPGITPIITDNNDFYRIDTAIVVPQLETSTWSLSITGMVDNPFTLTWDDLIALPLVEEYVTLTCVSDPVGGNLISNAKWLGYPLASLLERAKVKSGADQIIGRSVDGFTVGIPTEAATDGRVALLAIGMNDEPLPFEHGYPARLVIAGLYGYVSATKWVTGLELSTFSNFSSFWAERGWAQKAPIKTESRIDVPSDGASIVEGQVTIAGVAWAQSRGIARVDVRVDGGTWQPATLSTPIGKNCWLQWTVPWNAVPGQHTIQVRATDATNTPQTAAVQDVLPDGATGYHTISVAVG